MASLGDFGTVSFGLDVTFEVSFVVQMSLVSVCGAPLGLESCRRAWLFVAVLACLAGSSVVGGPGFTVDCVDFTACPGVLPVVSFFFGIPFRTLAAFLTPCLMELATWLRFDSEPDFMIDLGQVINQKDKQHSEACLSAVL